MVFGNLRGHSSIRMTLPLACRARNSLWRVYSTSNVLSGHERNSRILCAILCIRKISSPSWLFYGLTNRNRQSLSDPLAAKRKTDQFYDAYFIRTGKTCLESLELRVGFVTQCAKNVSVTNSVPTTTVWGTKIHKHETKHFFRAQSVYLEHKLERYATHCSHFVASLYAQIDTCQMSHSNHDQCCFPIHDSEQHSLGQLANTFVIAGELRPVLTSPFPVF